MSTEGGAASSPSNTSPVNEDAYLVHDGLGLYVVADGASSAGAGEIAARLAVHALEDSIRALKPDAGLSSLFSTFPTKGAVRAAMRGAMTRIIERAESDGGFGNMSATITMLLADGERAFVSHVGDSRLYLVRDGYLHQLTSDHDLTVPAGASSAQVYADAPIEVFSIDLRDTDIFLLCTDGAEDVIEDAELLGRVSDLKPRAIAAEIVRRASRVNPERDATVVVVRVLEEDDSGWMEVSEPLRPWAYGYAVEYA